MSLTPVCIGCICDDIRIIHNFLVNLPCKPLPHLFLCVILHVHAPLHQASIQHRVIVIDTHLKRVDSALSNGIAALQFDRVRVGPRDMIRVHRERPVLLVELGPCRQVPYREAGCVCVARLHRIVEGTGVLERRG